MRQKWGKVLIKLKQNWTTSVQDPLSMHRTTSNEATIISKIPNTINKVNLIIVAGQGKKQFQF